MKLIIDEFKNLGMSASYHYADDTGKEWGLADNAKAAALKLFDGNPEMQSQMRDIAHNFLWSLEMARPSKSTP